MSAVLSAAPAIACRDIGVRFFTERRDVTAIKSLDLEVAQGDYAEFVHHYLAIGKARGYRPAPPE